jgi:hypothetical protein
MVADAEQVADERQALVLRAQAQALAQGQPGEPEWRQGVLALEPVADDLAAGYSVVCCLGEHCREPVAAELRRVRELPGRWVCSRRWVELPQPRLVCRDWRMRTAGDSVRPHAVAVPALPWEEFAARARQRLRLAVAGE